MSRTNEFKLTRLSQRYRSANTDELGELGLRAKEKVMVREVILWSGDMPLVFAHSIAGRRDLAGTWRSLRGLGTRPLAAMLFANPRVTRQPIEFQCLDKRHPLYREAVAMFPTLPRELWARRSVFLLKGKPLLVTEVFLPGVQNLGK
jgi:chorismate lyase